ncbi:DUF3099 domain-containing protein [Micromonospora zhanjiangensis]|uniref:DUF3099 domain-containing protein n=1 Tax=Micromonospora zhanjiangensis TaxID=1522057 RepID=A0ABV8KHN4_9ACTN
MVKQPAYRPILITDAARSQNDQLHSRQVRYVVMMGIRAVCLIAGAVLVSFKAPMLWLWLPLCLIGMVLIPWLAVLLANDRPPKEEHRLANRLKRQHRDDTPARTLTAEERPHPTHPTIDAEP